ncbi:MAG TPA: aminotransferase class I/II-fold pyridoxal phosphate-dependent enzyme, partial [Pedococcus sp.]|nr:aminotransferase class I/II-fold pyridoxal phosphate-dependent enzyme [Pedococcus sp.]
MGPRALPDFPWDSLAPYKERASSVAGGLVDLSVGTPVDPTPQVVQEALRSASDAPGYPLTWGTPDLREAVAAWFARRRGVPDVDPDSVLPTMGSKELVAWLPTLLGVGPGEVVGFPGIAYPTYDVGVRLAGATPQVVDGLAALGPLTPSTTPKLLWLNSPSNPTGRVL